MAWQGSHRHRSHRQFPADQCGLREGSRECAWFSHRPLSAGKSRSHLLLTTRHRAGSGPASRSPAAGNTHPSDSWIPRSPPSLRSFSLLPKCLGGRLQPVLSSSLLPTCLLSPLPPLLHRMGSEKEKVDPFPFALSTHIVPP